MLAENFIDIFARDPKEADKFLAFYQQPFTIDTVLEAFIGWSQSREIEERRTVVLANSSPRGWVTEIHIHDNFEYGFFNTNDDDDESNCWQYVPKTMSEFVSDCLRYEDIHLEFSPFFLRKLKIEKYLKEIDGEAR